ncbi:MAG: ClbS/DfsB family four-helix bundle protein [Candidatus Margulisbacteria bacterium]|jgi:hypothetical protein|nr:ClbS/DfsB family four-helix bundle protein [Candidatus Margulisiibacteriota bacterium]
MCGTQDKNARDLLMHLHRWHEMVIKWHKDNLAGKEAAFLPQGFTWRTTPELNLKFWHEYQNVNLAKAKRLVKESHKEVMDIINSHTNDELFKKGVYKWTGGTSLGAYLVSVTSSHYDWAMKLLKKMP